MTLRVSQAIVAFGLVSCAEASRPSDLPRGGASHQQPARPFSLNRRVPQAAADPPERSGPLPTARQEAVRTGNEDRSEVASAEDHVDEPLDLLGYAVYAGVALVPAVHGTRGRLELLQDKRLTAALRNAIAGGVGCDPKEDPEFCESVDREPLRPAVVRVSDATGHDIAVRRLRRELAFLETAYLYGTRKPTYLVAVDLRAGAGGWAPICTYLAEVEHGTLHWLSAVLVEDGRRFEITLCNSHHANWHIVAAQGRRAKDLVFVEGGVDGTLSLGRYTWDGTTWRLEISRSVGNWDSDRPFPDLRQFPSAASPTR